VKKTERIEEFVATLGVGGSKGLDSCYLGYFECFNSQRYYEAHDVLEHLWLREGRGASDYAFYKGLIQLAGGFVHLKLQHAQPEHPKHGHRLAPARRLFLLAATNLSPYGPRHLGLGLEHPVSLALTMVELLERDGVVNPWNPSTAPHLPLPELTVKAP
jgi:predicted metal-dependent hydrolase